MRHRRLRRATSAIPGTFPFTRGVQPTMYRGRLWTMRQYAGFGTARRDQRALPAAARRAGRPGCPSRSICRRRWASTPTRRARSARSGASASRSTRSRTCTRCSTASRSTRVSTSMTINATAATLLAMYIVVAEERGIARATAERHDPERHPQGVHRARHVHLSARRRSLALIAEIFRFCAAEVPSWNPISISGYHIREAGATAVQELAFTFANAIEYVRARDRRRARGRRLRAAAVVLLRRAQRSVRGGREVPRRAPHLRAPDARALRRERRELPAALPHADGRRDAHGAAAAQQRRARRRAGAGGGARRHAVAAHERLRRGAGAADGGGGDARAAHAADHRLRERASRTPPIRSRGATTSRQLTTELERRRWRCSRRWTSCGGAARAIEAGFFQEEIGRSRVRASAARRARRDGDRRREQFADGETSRRRSRRRTTRRSSGIRSRGSREVRARRDGERGAERALAALGDAAATYVEDAQAARAELMPLHRRRRARARERRRDQRHAARALGRASPGVSAS